jgi:signal transduction histidine kinase
MLTTSQRIAFRFALTIAGIVLFLGFVINWAFFGSRWKREQLWLQTQTMSGPNEMKFLEKMQKKFAKSLWRNMWPRNMLFVELDKNEQEELIEHTLVKNLAHFDDERYLYISTGEKDQLMVMDISPVVHNQIALLRITLFAVFGSSVIGYAVAVRQVKRGLKDLKVLAKKVKRIDIDSLHNNLTFDHLPEHDEIHIVSRAIDEMTTKLHHQVSTIKQFVANVSHEFKTPLMSLQSTLDVGEKTKNYESVLSQTRDQIGIMNRLLDTLTILTNAQSNTVLEKSVLKLEDVLVPLILTMQEKYPHIQFEQTIDAKATVRAHQWFLERIVSNLLDNAGKFTPAWWTVSLLADSHGIQITDTWSGISPEQLTRIREPFWQGDAARWTDGFGLGLALVRQLVTLLGWDIVVKSALGEWTTVTIKR